MSTPTSIHHGLSVLSDADPSQRLAHPLPAINIESYDAVSLVGKAYREGLNPLHVLLGLPGTQFIPDKTEKRPRQVFNVFNDATTYIGYKNHPVKYDGGHPGIDYLCTVGHKVQAMYGGIVESVGPDSTNSNNVTIRSWTNWNPRGADRLGFDIIYSHLHGYSVAPGDVVKKGQIIGISGNTGHYRIPHLHVGFKAFDASGDVTMETVPDPLNYHSDPLIAPVAKRIDGFMNFACFLPADEAPAINSGDIQQGTKLLSIRTAFPFNPEELEKKDFVPVYTTKPESYVSADLDNPNAPNVLFQPSDWLPHSKIGCYVVLAEADAVTLMGPHTITYKLYQIQWKPGQKHWVPAKRNVEKSLLGLPGFAHDVEVVQVEEASIPPLPDFAVAHTKHPGQPDSVDVHANPYIPYHSYLGVPTSTNSLGQLTDGEGYDILGTYLDRDPFWHGVSESVVEEARRRWWQIDLSPGLANPTGPEPDYGWVRSDTVNEAGPTGDIALGWPHAPRNLEALVQGDRVSVSWQPDESLASAPFHLEATGYRVWRLEEGVYGRLRETLVQDVQSPHANDPAQKIVWEDSVRQPRPHIFYYQVAALMGDTVGPRTALASPSAVVTTSTVDAISEAAVLAYLGQPGPSSLALLAGPSIHPGRTVRDFILQPGRLNARHAVGRFENFVSGNQREAWLRLRQAVGGAGGASSSRGARGARGATGQASGHVHGWAPMEVLEGDPGWEALVPSLPETPLLRAPDGHSVPVRIGPSTGYTENVTVINVSSGWYEIIGRNGAWWQIQATATHRGWVPAALVETTEEVSSVPFAAAVEPPNPPGAGGGDVDEDEPTWASGQYRNLSTNWEGGWTVWKEGTKVYAIFRSSRSPVQYHARQHPVDLFVLPEGFWPTATKDITVTGTHVHKNGVVFANGATQTFTLRVHTSGAVRYVDGPELSDVGFLRYEIDTSDADDYWRTDTEATQDEREETDLSGSDSGTFHNQETNPDSSWFLRRTGDRVRGAFTSTSSPVQYYSLQNPEALVWLPRQFWPERDARFEVTGASRVDEDGNLTGDAREVDFWITVRASDGRMYYDRDTSLETQGVGHLSYSVDVAWDAETPVQVPSAPRDLEVEEVTADAVELDWRRPEDDGGDSVDEYKVEIYRNGRWREEEDDISRTRYTVEGLAAYTRYSFRVAARNSEDWGPYSTAVSVTTRREKPNQPRSLAAAATHDTVTVDWSAPAGSASVTGYRVARREGSSGSYVVVDPDTGSGVTHCVDRQVAVASSYSYQVQALNYGEPGSWSSARAITTRGAPTIPGQVTALSVAPGAHSQLSLSWTAPSDTGGGVTGYRVERSPDATPRDWTVIEADTGSEATTWEERETLEADRDYHYRVSACNSAGAGLASAEETGHTRPRLRLDRPVRYPLTARAEPRGDAEATATFPFFLPHRTFDLAGRTEGSGGWQRILGFHAAHTNNLWLPAAAGSQQGGSQDLSQVPGAPVGFTATLAANNEVTLAWSVPATGAAVTGYRVWRQAGDAAFAQLGSDLAATVTDYTDDTVTVGQAYRYWLQALSAEGAGVPSGIRALAVMSTAAAPASVENLAGTPTTTSLPLSWQKAATGGLPAEYRVEWQATGATDAESVMVAGTSHELTDLRPDTEHTVKVVACNQEGEAAAASRTASTLDAAPGTPTAVSVAVAGNGAAVSWQAPVAGGYATSYEVQSKARADGWPSTSTTRTVLDHALTGLTFAAEYDLRVRAVNTEGSSDWVALAFTAGPERPGAVRDLAAAPGADSQMQLTWRAPADHSVVTGHRIERAVDASPLVWSEVEADTATADTSWSDSGLDAATTYHYRVTGRSVAGPGTEPAEAEGTTRPQAALEATATYPLQAYADPQTTATVTHTWTMHDDTVQLDIAGQAAGGGAWYRVLRFGESAGGPYWLPAASVTVTGATTAVPEAPGVPTGLTASATHNRVALTWTAPTTGGTVTRYRIWRRIGTGAFTLLETDPESTALTHTDWDRDAATAHAYRVQALSAAGGGPRTAAVNVTTEPTPVAPDAPTGLTVTQGSDSQMALSWTAPAVTGTHDLVGYLVERSPDTDPKTWFFLLDHVNTTDTSWSESGLAADTVHHYRVRAVSAAGAGEASDAAEGRTRPQAALLADAGYPLTAHAWPEAEAPATHNWASHDGAVQLDVVGQGAGGGGWYRVLRFGESASGPYWLAAAAVAVTGAVTDVPEAPGVPGTFASSAVTHEAVTLRWTAPATGGTVTGYRLWRQTGSGTPAVLGADLAADVLTFTDLGLTAETAYGYRLQALSEAGAGVRTAAVDVATLPGAPGVPTDLAAAPSADSQMQLSWTAPVSGGAVTGHRIERAVDAATLAWTELVSDTGTADTSWSDSGLSAATAYHYRVSARSSVGLGDPSDEAEGTTRPQAALAAAATYPLTAHAWPEATAPETHRWAVHDAAVQLDVVGQGAGGGGWWRVLRFGAGAAGPYWLPAAAVVVTGSTAAVPQAPGAPTALTAGPGADSRMVLTWAAPATGGPVTGHRIERAVDAPTLDWREAEADTGTTATTWTDNNLAAATAYRYRVSARNSVGLGDPSDDTAGTTRPQAALSAAATYPLTAHQWPEAEAPATHSWAAHDGAVQLDVVGQGAGGGGWYRVLRFGESASGPYWLAATSVAVTGAVTAVPEAPGVPGTFASSAVTHEAVTLRWTAPATGGPVTGYRLWRREGTGSWAVPGGDLAAGVLTFTDLGLTAETDYGYRLQALSEAGAGVRTAAVDVATLPGAPGVPTDLAAAPSADSQMQLRWTAPVSGGAVTGYRIERAEDAATLAWTELVSDTGTADTSWSDSGLAAATAYHYRVTARSAAGLGTESAETSGTTRPQAALAAAATYPLTAHAWPEATAPETHRWAVHDAAVTLDIVGQGPAGAWWRVLRFGAGAAGPYWLPAAAVVVTGSTAAVPQAPGAPTALTAGPGTDSRMVLTWTAPTTGGPVTGHRIERAVDAPTPVWTEAVADTGTTATTWTDNNLAASTAYRYRVRALSGPEPGEPSGSAAGTTRPQAALLAAAAYPLAARAWPLATAPATHTWDAHDGAVQLDVAGKVGGTDGWWRVLRFGAEADGPFWLPAASVEVTGDAMGVLEVPGVPGDLAVAEVTDTQTVLTWTAPVTGDTVTGYRLWRQQGTEAWAVIGESLAAEVLTHTDTGLAVSTGYRYRLQALSAGGPGIPATAGAITAALPPQVRNYNDGDHTLTIPSGYDHVYVQFCGGGGGGGGAGSDYGSHYGEEGGLGGVTYYRGTVAAGDILELEIAEGGEGGEGHDNDDLNPQDGEHGGTSVLKLNRRTVAIGKRGLGGEGGVDQDTDNDGNIRGSSVGWPSSWPGDRRRPAGGRAGYRDRRRGDGGDGEDGFARVLLTPIAPLVVPGTPTDLAAAPSADSQMALSWTAPATGAAVTGYRIERAVAAATLNWTVVEADTGTTDTIWSDRGLTGGTTYHYRVTALSGMEPGEPSGSADGTTRPQLALSVAATYPLSARAWPAGDAPAMHSWAVHDAAVQLDVVGQGAGGGGWWRVLRFGAGAAGPYWLPAAAVAVTGATTDVPEAPGVPGTFESSAVTHERATLSWTAPTTGGTVTGYRLWRQTGSEVYVLLGSDLAADVLTHTDRTVAAATPYQYRVQALSAAGAGVPTAPVGATTAETPREPGVPTILAAVPGADSRMVVSWTAPVDPGTEVITGYRIERAEEAATLDWREAEADTGTTATTWTDNNLAAATVYRYRVSARNSVGLGDPSDDTAGTTRPQAALLSAATYPLTAHAWPATEAPATHAWDLHDAAVQLDVVGQGAGGGGWYRVLRFGESASGPYWLAAASVAVTGAVTAVPEAPGVPGTFASSAVTHEAVTLRWTAPATGGPVTGYRLWRREGTGSWAVPGGDLAAGVLSFTDSGLTAETAYGYRLQALSAAGAGVRTAAVDVATLPGVPGVPMDLAAAPGADSQMQLSWTAPVSGAAVTGYRIERAEDAATLAWTELVSDTGTAATVWSDSGLSAATAYHYRVTARSAAGLGTVSDETSGTTRPQLALSAAATYPLSARAWPAGDAPATHGWAAHDAAVQLDVVGQGAGGGGWWRVLRFGAGAAGPYWLPAASVTVTGATTDVPEAPGVPGTFESSAVTHERATLNWSAPTTGGTVTGYRLWRQTGAAAFTVLGADLAADVLTHTDTSVAESTAYQYRVQALSAAGAGAPAAAVGVRTAATPRAPGVPTILAAAPGPDSRMVVTWAAPADAGTQPITGYRIERAEEAATLDWREAEADTGTTATTWTDNNLAAATAYRYRVSARNSVGLGDPSDDTAGTTRPQAALRAAAAYPLTAHQWPEAEAPATHNWAAHDAAVQLDVVGKGAAGAWYRVLRFGAGAAGPYWLAAASVEVTGAVTAVPAAAGVPGTFRSTAITHESVTLGWSAPTTGGPVTGYRLWRQEGSGTPAVLGADLAADVLTFTDVGLTAETAYAYRLQALSEAGAGVRTPALDIATLPGAPGVPTDLAAVPSADSQMVLNWTAPASGAAVTGYRIERAEDAATLAWTEAEADTGTAATVWSDSGLSAATVYHYRVTARSAAGLGTVSEETSGTTRPQVGLLAGAGYPVTARAWPLATAPATHSWAAHDDMVQLDVVGQGAGGGNWYRVLRFGAGAAGPYWLPAASVTVTGATTDVPEAPGVPGEPAPPTATHDSVTLRWTAPATGGPVTGYRLWRQEGEEDFTVLGTDLAAAVLTHTDTTVAPATAYHYRVQALSAAGAGVRTAPVGTTTAETPRKPGAPTDLSAAPGADSRMVLTWTAPVDPGTEVITGYRIERAAAAPTPVWTEAETDTGSPATTWSDSSLTGGTAYRYRVSARNSVGLGDASTEAEGTARPQAALRATATYPLTAHRWPSAMAPTSHTWTAHDALVKLDVVGQGAGGGGWYRVLRFGQGAAGPYWLPAASVTVTGAVTDVPQAPGVPGDFGTTDLQGRVVLGWSAPTTGGTVTGYRLWRQVGEGASSVLTDSLDAAALTHTDTNVTAGTTYRYRLQAQSATGHGVRTEALDAVVAAPPAPPAAPDYVVVAQVAAGVAQLFWDPVAEATGYAAEVRQWWHADTHAEAWVGVPATGTLTLQTGATSTATVTVVRTGTLVELGGLPTGGSYGYWDFRVRAVNAGGPSAWEEVFVSSAASNRVPRQPGGLAGRRTAAGTATLSWSAVAGAADYRVYFDFPADDQGSAGWDWLPYRGVAIAVTGTTAVVSGLPATAASWDFRVVARDADTNESLRSAVLAVSTATAPGAPTALTAAPGADSQMQLVWTAPADAGGQPLTGYRIERSRDVNPRDWTDAVVDIAGPATTWTDATGLAAATTYHYQVRARNSVGLGDASDEMSGTTRPQAALSATAGYPLAARRWPEAAAPATHTWTAHDALVKLDLAAQGPGPGVWYRVLRFGESASGPYWLPAAAVTVTGAVADLPAVPAAPPTLTAAPAGESQMQLTWTAAATGGAATGYRIERSPDATPRDWTDAVADTGATATTWADSGLDGGTTYRYRVTGRNAAGLGVPSAEASGTTRPRLTLLSTAAYPLTAHAWPVATAPATHTWPAHDAAVVLELLARDPDSGWFRVLRPGESAAGPYWLPAAAVAVTGATADLPQVPGVPGDFPAPAATHASVTLSWTAPATGGTVTGYRLWRQTDEAAFAVLGTDLAGDVLTHTDTTVMADTAYRYRVQALSEAGAGVRNAPVDVTTAETPRVPGAPTILAAAPGADSRMAVSWEAPADAGTQPITGYRIERAEDAATLDWQDAEADTGTTATTWSDNNLAAATRYRYRVSARNRVGLGEASGETDGTTRPQAALLATAAYPLTAHQWPAATAPTSHTWTAHDAMAKLDVVGQGPGGGGWYRVLRFGESANGPYWLPAAAVSVTGAVTDVPEAPGMPGALEATETQGRVVLNWSYPATGGTVTGYRLWRQAGEAAWVVLTDSLDWSAYDHTDTDVTIGSPYRYRLQARSEAGYGPRTVALGVTVTPPPPPRPAYCGAIQTGAGALTLVWDPVSEATGYEIEIQQSHGDTYVRLPAAGTFSLRTGPDAADVVTVTVAGTGTTRQLSGLPTGYASWRLDVRATNAGGESNWRGTTVSNNPANLAPATPTGLSGRRSAAGTAALSWDAVTGATEYRVYFDFQGSTDWDYLPYYDVTVTVTGATATVGGLPAAAADWGFRVSALNDVFAESLASAPITVANTI